MDSVKLRNAFGYFATGVTVVTHNCESVVKGMTVNSFSSVSLEPPLVSFCPSIHCQFAKQVQPGDSFTISVLSSLQKDTCFHFAGRPLKRAPNFHPLDADSVPGVEGALYYYVCRLKDKFLQGDHYIAVGDVLQLVEGKKGEPLLFFRGAFLL